MNSLDSSNPRDIDEFREDIIRRISDDEDFAILVTGAFWARSPDDYKFTRYALEKVNGLSDLVALVDEVYQLTDSFRNVLVTFHTFGWAVTGQTPQGIMDRAHQILIETGRIDEAEAVITEHFKDLPQLRRMVPKLSSLELKYRPLIRRLAERDRLIHSAIRHHVNGDYDASVPIVFAQIDGLVRDTTDQDFFSKREQRGFTDSDTIAGMPEGLDALRPLFTKDQNETGLTGKLSRHGIIHGRELRYDNAVNSTKVFFLLTAIIEWAAPKLTEKDKHHYAEQLRRYAGTDEVDDDGRRLDDREFDDARTALGRLLVEQDNEFRKHGRYASSLGDLFSRELCDRWLINCDRVQLRTNDERTHFWAWWETPSGFCLGIGDIEGTQSNHLFAADSPPVGGIGSDGRWASLEDPVPADWM